MKSLRNLFTYFENVLHPASGWSDGSSAKRKRPAKKNDFLYTSPESFNLRGSTLKKEDKVRRSPAP
jgi:hypothetical protein